MPDEQVTDERPGVTREERNQRLLDRDRVSLAGEPQAARQALHVRVDDDAFVDVEGVPQHDVGGLAAHTAQLDELREAFRHFAAILAHQGVRHRDETFRLGTKEPGALDDVFDFFGIRVSQRGRIRKSCEQHRCHHVHPNIGALRAENRGRHQFKRRAKIEFAMCVRIFA